MRRMWVHLLILTTVMGMACASAKVASRRSLDQAAAQVQQADQGPTAEFASVELYKAKEKLQEAQRAQEQEEYVKARRLSEQATADAEYAVAKSKVARLDAFAKTGKKSTEMTGR